jgi:hypothetical protein
LRIHLKEILPILFLVVTLFSPYAYSGKEEYQRAWRDYERVRFVYHGLNGLLGLVRGNMEDHQYKEYRALLFGQYRVSDETLDEIENEELREASKIVLESLFMLTERAEGRSEGSDNQPNPTARISPIILHAALEQAKAQVQTILEQEGEKLKTLNLGEWVASPPKVYPQKELPAEDRIEVMDICILPIEMQETFSQDLDALFQHKLYDRRTFKPDSKSDVRILVNLLQFESNVVSSKFKIVIGGKIRQTFSQALEVDKKGHLREKSRLMLDGLFSQALGLEDTQDAQLEHGPGEIELESF